jgi:hypothetical protein
VTGHKKTRHGAGWGFHFALLVAASEFMQLKPQIADFQFEGFRRAYVGLKNKKTRSRRVIHPESGYSRLIN